MKTRKIITIGIPCYNEQENIHVTYATVKKIISPLSKKYEFKLLFTDNGSNDDTRVAISKLAKKDKTVQGIFLSRNFGIEASFAALLDLAKGDAMILLFCDLQDPAELIPKFIADWEKGSNIVVARYTNTEDDVFTLLLRRAFYFVFKHISNIDVPVNASGVGLMDRKTLNVLKSLPETYRFFRGLRAWIGFKTSFVLYRRKKREHGVSSYNLLSLIQHAERGVYGFSYLFLDIMSYSGLTGAIVACILAVLYLIYVGVTETRIDPIAALFLLVCVFGSLQFMAIGILGKYIQVVVEETKKRPVYVIDELLGVTR